MSRPQTNIKNKYDRLIALIDMDCFYCQVEEKLNPELAGKPIAVVQYNAWRGGGIIAVNYPAREHGVTRHMRGDEAKEQCPDIELVKVPNIREKADLSKYRNAGKEVATVLQTFTPLLSRASVDEAYLDLTEQVQNRLLDMNKGKFSLQPHSLQNTYVVGYDGIAKYVQKISEKITHSNDDDLNIPEEDLKSYKKSDIKLLIASSIVSEIRAAVKEQTGYDCSAGIAHNKVLAKLVCGLNKPNKQTILPINYIPQLFSTLPVRKVQGLGGKFGEKMCEDLGIKHMGELINFSKEELVRRYDERSGQWLYNIARGIDLEAITPRLVSKSIGCCKKFPGRNAISAMTTLNHWLHELAVEISERLEQDEIENNRRPKQMVVSFMQTINSVDVSSSRSVNMTSTDVERIVSDAMDVLKRNTDKFFKSADSCTVLNNPIKFLGLNVGKFESTDSKKGNTIQNMFQRTIENQKNEAQSDIQSETHSELSNQGDESNDGKVENDQHESEENKQVNEPEASTSKEDKKDDTKKSFFLNYHRMKKEQEEQALKAEHEAATLINESEGSDQENTFQNDMLLEELEQNNQPNNDQENNAELPAPTSSETNYKELYAEFYRPPPVEVPKIECDQCGKRFAEYDLQIHKDEHFAFQLTQEQRAEFQNQLKRSIPTAPPAAKKLKTSASTSKNKTPSKAATIQKFFVKMGQEDATSSTSNTDNVETETCKECNKNIPITEIFEHMDYHAAKKLQAELMRSESIANQTNNNTIQSSVSKSGNASKSKNVKKTASSSNNPTNAKKNIASFFQNS